MEEQKRGVKKKKKENIDNNFCITRATITKTATTATTTTTNTTAIPTTTTLIPITTKTRKREYTFLRPLVISTLS